MPVGWKTSAFKPQAATDFLEGPWNLGIVPELIGTLYLPGADHNLLFILP